MGLIKWDKAEKARSFAEHAERFSADSAPPGTYVPNMSQHDMETWKGKVAGARAGYPQVELRKSIRGVQLLVIVNLGTGYSYKHWKPTGGRWPSDNTAGNGVNIHLAINGGLRLSFDEFEEIRQVIEEAKARLAELATA